MLKLKYSGPRQSHGDPRWDLDGSHGPAPRHRPHLLHCQIARQGFHPLGRHVKINFAVFLPAALVSRSARFFLLVGLIYKFGPGIQSFIDRYFDILAVTFTVLLVLGFVVIKYVF